MSELLGAAAAALGLPEPLVQRSAAARAAETGATVDEVLTAWAGGGDMPAPATAADTQTEPEKATADEQAVDVTPEAPQPAPARVEAPAAATTAPTTAPMPAEVTLREAAHLPEVITVPTAGIRERTGSSMPRWLTSVLLAAPLVALFALGGAATGECGEATELRTDVITGEIVDCDGSRFTGRSPVGPGQDFIGMGEGIFAGTGVAGLNCASCHGAQGQGLGGFPAMTAVITTFGSCSDHIEWVALGSIGFRNAGRTTYGDTDKPVAGGMPSFGGSLTEEQLAAVVAFERVRFAGGDTESVLADCGLAEDPDAENGENGGEPGDDEGTGEDQEMPEAQGPSRKTS